jgi:hypothetical protein
VNEKFVRISLVAAIVVVAAAGTGWYHAGGSLRELRAGELVSIAALLKEDQDLLQVLQAGSTDKQSGILGSYLASIRADGLPKHAETKQRLDRLAENNSAIVGLLNVYAPHAKSGAFGAESQKFVHYAIAWRDRWNSVMELFMAGGNYPVAEIPFPMGFSTAIEAEIASLR